MSGAVDDTIYTGDDFKDNYLDKIAWIVENGNPTRYGIEYAICDSVDSDTVDTIAGCSNIDDDIAKLLLESPVGTSRRLNEILKDNPAISSEFKEKYLG